MKKKGQNTRNNHHTLAVGVCFEPLEPRLLLSGSWGAGVEASPSDSQANTPDERGRETVALHADAGISDTQASQQHRLQIIGRVDLLANAPVMKAFAAGETIEAADHGAASADRTQELIFVDTGIQNYEQLIDDIIANADDDRSFEVIILEADRNGVDQISQALADRQDLDAVHFVTHGEAGAVKLGSTLLNSGNVDDYQGDISGWQDALSSEADLLFYGCDLAAGEDGRMLLDRLSTLTRADVSASDDLTGSARMGGDWVLEYSNGEIETRVVTSPETPQHWSGVLATFTVDTAADTPDANPGDGQAQDASGNTSLRAAIEEANDLAGADEITLNAGTYTLSGGDLVIREDLTIHGANPNTTAVDGNAADRVFTIENTSTATLTGVTIMNGNQNNSGGVFIDNGSTLYLSDSIVRDNASNMGGGVHVHGTAHLDRVLMVNNTADDGGAIHFHGADGGSLTNVTISGNTAAAEGGGLWTDSSITITNVTVANNNATNQGGGLYVGGGVVDIANSIVADNSAGATGPDISGTLTSSGSNIFESFAGISGLHGSDVSAVDPLLALSDNGGILLTHAPTTVEAIDTADRSLMPTTDQRGFLRGDGSPDIGAYEAGASAASTADYLDQFNTDASFAGDDGALPWSNHWQEVGEPPDAGGGDVQVSDEFFGDGGGNTELWIKLNKGVWREADLSGATSATLSFNYVRANLEADDHLVVYVQVGGGIGPDNIAAAPLTGTWYEIGRYSGVADDAAYLSDSIDLSAYIGSDTRIMFLAEGVTAGNDKIFVDNVRIDLSTAPPPDITSDLIVHLEFEEGANTTAFDSTAYGNDAHLTGTPDWVSGPVGGSFHFDYSDGADFFEINNAASVENVQEGSFTLAAWFKADDVPPVSDAYGIIVKEGFHTGVWYNSNRQFVFEVTQAGPSYPRVVSTNTYDPGSFHHIAVTLDRPSGTMTLYVDGVLENTSSFTPGAASWEYNSETWKIGTARDFIPSFVDFPAKGSIDDVRIYSRAISAADAAALVDLGNRAPTAISLDNTSVAENAAGAIIGNLSTTDPDAGDSHTYTVDDARFEVVAGQLKLKATDSLNHESEPTVDVTVTSTDSGGLTTNQLFTITVSDVNDAPTATNLTTTSSYTEGVGSVAITDIVVSDVDTGETITATLTLTDTATGSLSANNGATYDGGTGIWMITDSVINVNVALANLVFTPNADNDVDTTIGVVIDDGDEDNSGPLTGTITLDVTPVNDAPTASGTYSMTSTDENTTSIAVQISAILSDASITAGDVDGDTLGIAVIATTGLGNWQYSTNGVSGWTNFGTVNPNAALLLSETTWVRYVPDGVNGENSGFDFCAWDQTADIASVNGTPRFGDTVPGGGTGAYSLGNASVALTVNPVNDEQVLSTNSGLTVVEGSIDNVITTAMLETTDADNTTVEVVYTITALPTYGTLYRNTTALLLNDTFTQDDIDNNRISYDHNGSENFLDSFDFDVDDGTGTATSDTFAITITPVNDNDPMAVDESITLAEGGTATTLVGGATSVLANDTDTDLPNDTLTVTVDTDVVNGTLTLNADGTFSYTHDGSENLTDSFTYTVSDADGGTTDTGTVSIAITPVNDNDPVAVDESITLAEGGTATTLVGGATSVLANDTDTDLPNDTLTVTVDTDVVNGTLTLNADGTFSYTHDGSENLTDSFTYTVSDADGGTTDTGTVSIAITPVNDVPKISLINTTTTIAEDVDTGSAIKVADIVITDDAMGINGLSLSGADAAMFEIVGGNALYLRAGVLLDSVSNPSLDVTVAVDDTAVGGVPDDWTFQTISVTAAVAVTPPPTTPVVDNPSDGGDTVEPGPDTPAETIEPIAEPEAEPVESVPEAAAPPVTVVDVQAPVSQAGSFVAARTPYLIKAVGQFTRVLATDPTVKAIVQRQLNTSSVLREAAPTDKGSQQADHQTDQRHRMAARAYLNMVNSLDDVKKEMAGEIAFNQTVLGSAIAMSTGLSVGYVVWLIRGGMLLSSLLSSIPAWQILDPLPVLAGRRGEDDLDDDESLASIIDRKPPEKEAKKKPTGAPLGYKENHSQS